MPTTDYLPGTARQAVICSHEDHLDFVYEGDKPLYDAWVSWNPVTGEYHYPDPLWDPEWVDKDYTTD